MKFLFSTFSLALLLIGGVGGYVVFTWPDVGELRQCMTPSMFKVRLCPGGKDYVPLTKISKYLRAAIIASEDAKFYQHVGFDFESLQKVLQENLEKRG